MGHLLARGVSQTPTVASLAPRTILARECMSLECRTPPHLENPNGIDGGDVRPANGFPALCLAKRGEGY